jgi:ElaB/YqjD/DUF883 family membrane-anchored ribosome-binding protein
MNPRHQQPGHKRQADEHQEEVIMEIPDEVTKSAHRAADKVASVAGQASEVLGETGQQLKAAEQRLMANCRGYVRDNPVTSLGIAVGAGFILSRLLSAR